MEVPQWRVISFTEKAELVKKIRKKSRSLAQVKAPPQKRRAVIRVESAETQDKV